MSELNSSSGTIVVTLDGSQPAQSAATVAVQIANSQDYAIHGLYIVDEPLVLDPYANYQAELNIAESFSDRDEVVAAFEAQGDQTLQWLEEICQTANVPITSEMLFSGVSEIIQARTQEATLLALGRRGNRHEASPRHLGSHFRAIAHHASLPLVVGGDEPQTIRRLLLAYNGSESAQQTLMWTCILQRSLQAEVVVLFAQESKKQDQTEQWLENVQAHLVPEARPHFQFLTRTGRAATEIVSAAVENRADLILMGSYKHHTSVLEWLSGSTLDWVLKNIPLPVLVA